MKSHSVLGRVCSAALPLCVATAALALSACGSAAPGGSSSPTGTSPSPSSVASGISSLITNISKAEGSSYTVTYEVASNGVTETFSYSQEGNKYHFVVNGANPAGNATLIDTGTHSYECTSVLGTDTCIQFTSDSGGIFSSLNLFSAEGIVNDLKLARSEAGLGAGKGTSITYSSATYAGQASTCAHVTVSTGTSVYCATDSGVLAYLSSGTSTVTLTSYSSTVNPADFALPAGATVTQLP